MDDAALQQPAREELSRKNGVRVERCRVLGILILRVLRLANLFARSMDPQNCCFGHNAYSASECVVRRSHLGLVWMPRSVCALPMSRRHGMFRTGELFYERAKRTIAKRTRPRSLSGARALACSRLRGSMTITSARPHFIPRPGASSSDG